MSLPLYFDQHVPGPMAAALRQRGVDVLTAEADGHKGTVDELLLTRATALGRILVTNDRDFLAIAAHWQRHGRHFAGIAYYADQNTPHGKRIGDLVLVTRVYAAEEMSDRIEHLPLSRIGSRLVAEGYDPTYAVAARRPPGRGDIRPWSESRPFVLCYERPDAR